MSEKTEPIVLRTEERFPARPGYKGKLWHLRCHVCGAEFTRPRTPYGEHRNYGLTCGMTCGRAFAHRNMHGEGHPNWKGGRHITGGYIRLLVPDAPTRYPYRYEHDLVMEKILGRALRPGEVVHHKNEDRQDNRPENLELKTIATHLRDHGVYDKPRRRKS
jgi:hypothetical protein